MAHGIVSTTRDREMRKLHHLQHEQLFQRPSLFTTTWQDLLKRPAVHSCQERVKRDSWGDLLKQPAVRSWQERVKRDSCQDHRFDATPFSKE